MGWFQALPQVSLDMFDTVGIGPNTRIIDVGGGISRLVDQLLQRGCESLTVLDLSAAALAVSRQRVGETGEAIHWIVGDVLDADLGGPFDIWHDRAVFHFLTDEAERQTYTERMDQHLTPGGHAIIATFAEDGPSHCNDLPVCRYSADQLHAQMGRNRFSLIESRQETHITPAGRQQSFQYCLFQKR